jgi:hypothetical protein
MPKRVFENKMDPKLLAARKWFRFRSFSTKFAPPLAGSGDLEEKIFYQQKIIEAFQKREAIRMGFRGVERATEWRDGPGHLFQINYFSKGVKIAPLRFELIIRKYLTRV